MVACFGVFEYVCVLYTFYIYVLYIHHREEDALEYLSRSVLCLHRKSPREMITDPSQAADPPFLLDSTVVLNSGRRADEGRGVSGAEVSDYEHCI